MFVRILLSCLAGTLLIAAGEVLRRRLKLGNEFSRKLLHIIHGLTVVAWSFLLPNSFIIGFEVLFFCGMFAFREIARRWPQYGWVYKVKRQSYGEFFYPIGIIGALLIAPDDWVFVAAVGQLAITDSVAALVGKTWGAQSEYKVFGTTKSVIGTVAFTLTAIAVFAVALLPSHSLTAAQIILGFGGGALFLAAVENVCGYGSDNFFLPVVTAALLSLTL